MGVFDSVVLRMLRRGNYMRERKLPRDSHVYNHEMQSVHKLGWETGWAHSLLSLAFATQWNQKHPSYVSIRLFFKIPSCSSAAECRLCEMFKATDKLSYVLIVELSKLDNSNKK